MDVESWIAIAGLLGISTGVASIILFICPQLTTCPLALQITLLIITIIIIRKFITRLLDKVYHILYEPLDLQSFSYTPDNLIITGLISLLAGISSISLSYNPDLLFGGSLAIGIMSTGIILICLIAIGAIIILTLAILLDLNQILTLIITFAFLFSILFQEELLYTITAKTNIDIILCTLCAIVSGFRVMFVWKITRSWRHS